MTTVQLLSFIMTSVIYNDVNKDDADGNAEDDNDGINQKVT